MVMFIPLGWKLWDIAIVHHDEYQKLASDQQALDLSISAQRGNIYDRNGNVMAMSATVYSLILSPNDLVKSVPNKDADGNELDSAVYQASIAAKQEQVLGDLITLLPDLDRERVNTQIHATKYSYREIKTKIEEEDTEALRTYIAENKTGAYLYLLPSTKRYYPYSSLAAQALGFVNSEGGAYGIEAVYNDVLEGTPGRVLTNKTAGGTERYNTYAQYVDAVDGCNLTLTIDATIQSYLEKTLDEGIRDFDVQDGAFGIAMDPKTGAILGIASSPDFDPNSYSQITNDLLSSQVSEDAAAIFEKLKAANTENLTDSELMAKAEAQAESNALNTQWRSKAIDSRYEPGSTFKALVLAAALEEGLVSESDHFYCSGSVQLADHTIHCSRRQGHLDQDLAKAVGNSCNPAFMEIGKRLGKDKFYEYFEAFGLMENTGIDLPGEASLKGAIWAKEKMGEVELATASFGQRFEVTPLQMICAFSAVINGGDLVKPYIVQSVSSRDGTVLQNTEPEVVRQVISQQTSQRAADILEKVVSDGTGGNAYVAGYRIGGKTVSFLQLGQGFQLFQIGRICQPVAEYVVFKHNFKNVGSVGRHQNFQKLVTNPFHRQVFQTVQVFAAGLKRFAVDRRFAEQGIKTEKSQNAHIVFANLPVGIADKTDDSFFQVFNTVIIVKNIAFFVGIDRVDGEVTLSGVGLPVVGKFHFDMAAAGFDLFF